MTKDLLYPPIISIPNSTPSRALSYWYPYAHYYPMPTLPSHYFHTQLYPQSGSILLLPICPLLPHAHSTLPLFQYPTLPPVGLYPIGTRMPITTPCPLYPPIISIPNSTPSRALSYWYPYAHYYPMPTLPSHYFNTQLYPQSGSIQILSIYPLLPHAHSTLPLSPYPTLPLVGLYPIVTQMPITTPCPLYPPIISIPNSTPSRALSYCYPYAHYYPMPTLPCFGMINPMPTSTLHAHPYLTLLPMPPQALMH